MNKAEKFLNSDDCPNIKSGFGLDDTQFNIIVVILEAYHQSRVNAINDDEKYCKYCGNKLTFKVETDINSGKECVNDLCKNKLIKQ